MFKLKFSQTLELPIQRYTLSGKNQQLKINQQITLFSHFSSHPICSKSSPVMSGAEEDVAMNMFVQSKKIKILELEMDMPFDNKN